MGQTTSYYDVREALAMPGCAICRLKTDAARQYLDMLVWESTNDPGVREDIRLARGLCREHAGTLMEAGPSLGASIIMRDVLHTVLEIGKQTGFQANPKLSLRRARETLDTGLPSAGTALLVSRLSAQARCPVCLQAETMEAIYLDMLVQYFLDRDGLQDEYRASDGLCLPHFRQALMRVREEPVFEALVGAQNAIWERLVGHLDEIIRKADYRFQHEARGEETGGTRRAVAAISGSPPDGVRK